MGGGDEGASQIAILLDMWLDYVSHGIVRGTDGCTYYGEMHSVLTVERRCDVNELNSGIEYTCIDTICGAAKALACNVPIGARCQHPTLPHQIFTLGPQ